MGQSNKILSYLKHKVFLYLLLIITCLFYLSHPYLPSYAKIINQDNESHIDLKTDLPKEEAPKVDTPKEEAPKVDTPKEEAPKVDTPKEEAPKVDTPKEEAPKLETPKLETPKEETPKEETPKKDNPKIPENFCTRINCPCGCDPIYERCIECPAVPSPVTNLHDEEHDKLEDPGNNSKPETPKNFPLENDLNPGDKKPKPENPKNLPPVENAVTDKGGRPIGNYPEVENLDGNNTQEPKIIKHFPVNFPASNGNTKGNPDLPKDFTFTENTSASNNKPELPVNIQPDIPTIVVPEIKTENCSCSSPDEVSENDLLQNEGLPDISCVEICAKEATTNPNLENDKPEVEK